MNNWDLEAAMQNAKDDIAWEKSQQQPPPPPKKELEDISSLALEAHIAIPVTTTTSVKKKKKNIELELGSVTAKVCISRVLYQHACVYLCCKLSA